MTKKNSKRKASVYLILIVLVILVLLVRDWKDVVQGAKDGWNEYHSSAEK